MSKHTSPIHLLAIDPGSRYLGVAVFEDLFLLNWRTQIIEDKGRSAQAAVSRVRQIVRQSIKEHHVTMVVVRPYCPCPRHTSKVVAAMVKEIQRFGKQQGLRVSRCDLLMPGHAGHEDGSREDYFHRPIPSPFAPPYL